MIETLADRYPVLAMLPPVLQRQLTQQARIVEVPAGTVLFDERQACLGFPLLLAGCICVSKRAPNGRELTLYRLLPGESCIISSGCLLGDIDYNAHALAETDCVLALLPEPLFTQLLDEPSFRRFVFAIFSLRVTELMQTIEQVAFLRLDQRLAALLLRKRSPIHATHQQLADELGSVREIVSRLLKTFADRDWIRLGRARLEVLDERGLRAVADGLTEVPEAATPAR